MNTIDVILTIALSFGFLKGFYKGFIVEVASIGALFLGLMGAVKFPDFIAKLLNNFFDWDPLAVKIGSYFNNILHNLILYFIIGPSFDQSRQQSLFGTF